MHGKRMVVLAVLAGLLFFGASYVVAKGIKDTTGPPPTKTPDAVVIERDTITVPGAAARFPDLPASERADSHIDTALACAYSRISATVRAPMPRAGTLTTRSNEGSSARFSRRRI